jgi:CheY-like chemotaxis protein
MRRALVVDDSRVGRRMIRSALPSDWEVEVFEAADGQEAIDLLASEPYDVVFLDLVMPGTDGYGVLEWLRETELDPIVVVVSTDLQPAAKVKVFLLGAFEFVTKPPDRGRIRRTLELAGLL